MRIFPKELEIGDEDGFKPELDIFKRHPVGRSLTQLLTTVEDPVVLAVDAEWGAGKTVFLKMWAGELRKLGVPVVYLDAFASDFAGDAFAAIAGEIVALAKSKKLEEQPAAETFIKSAVSAGRVILKASAKVAVKAATMGVVEAADLKEFGADAASVTTSAADDYMDRFLRSFDDQKLTLQAFRDALSELPGLLASEKPTEEKLGRKPLVIIIDELDRCNPPFALNVLERMKHFFSVPNVHFVLGVNARQLQNSIRATYGADIDAVSYLQKFIHVTMPLIETKQRMEETALATYIGYLAQTCEVPPHTRQVLGDFSEMLTVLAHTQSLSLRQAERAFTTCTVALSAMRSTSMIVSPIFAGLCFLKVMRPELYAKAKRGRLQFEEVRGPLGFDSMALVAGQQIATHVTEWWAFATQDHPHQNIIDKYSPALRLQDRRELVPRTANNYIDKFVVS